LCKEIDRVRYRRVELPRSRTGRRPEKHADVGTGEGDAERHAADQPAGHNRSKKNECRLHRRFFAVSIGFETISVIETYAGGISHLSGVPLAGLAELSSALVRTSWPVSG